MKNIKRAVALLLLTAVCTGLSACGSSEYARAQDSVGQRIRTGNFNNMSPTEKKAFNDYLDWDRNN